MQVVHRAHHSLLARGNVLLSHLTRGVRVCVLVAFCSQDDKRHGEGEYNWHTNDRYVGEWQQGSMSGSGTFHWHNGDRFTGGWLDGHMHGSGTKTLHNGDVITGTWQHGRQQGKGTKLFACGDKHTGLYKDDRSIRTNRQHHSHLLPVLATLSSIVTVRVARPGHQQRSFSMGHFLSVHGTSNVCLAVWFVVCAGVTGTGCIYGPRVTRTWVRGTTAACTGRAASTCAAATTTWASG